jgi:predicted dehydrogenase
LHWDLWLGPAPERPYHPTYLPGAWRRWWDFGGGTLADMGCHYLDLPFWALDLRYPATIEATGPPVHAETCPKNLRVQYEFPARDHFPPVKLTWSDGELRPEELLAEFGLADKKNGVLFVGENGALWADYDHRRLLPAERFAAVELPPRTIPDSIGHHAEWIQACQTGSPTTCNFEYGAALTETVLLGNVAYRTGKKLEWDATNLRVKNAPEAMQFIQHQYRSGWSL